MSESNKILYMYKASSDKLEGVKTFVTISPGPALVSEAAAHAPTIFRGKNFEFKLFFRGENIEQSEYYFLEVEI